MCFRPAAASMTIKCTNCGNECDPSEKVCPKCGHELPKAPAMPGAPGAPGMPIPPGKPAGTSFGAPSAPGAPDRGGK